MSVKEYDLVLVRGQMIMGDSHTGGAPSQDLTPMGGGGGPSTDPKMVVRNNGTVLWAPEAPEILF